MKIDQILPRIYVQLRLVVRTEVQKAFESYLNQSISDPSLANEDFLSAEQAAQYLKIKIGTLYAKVEKGELPFHRIGKRKLLFSKEELTDYIKNGKA